MGKLYVNNFEAPAPYMYTIGDNNIPILSSPEILTSLTRSKDACSPDFVSIVYTDSDNNLPTIHQAEIDGVVYEMYSNDHSYLDGALFEVEYPGIIPHGTDIVFSFSDDMDDAIMEIIFDINEDIHNKISQIDILDCFPNPFNPATTITVEVEKSSVHNISIYDARGALVKVIANRYLHNGVHQFEWKPDIEISSGIYYLIDKSADNIFKKRLIFIK